MKRFFLFLFVLGWYAIVNAQVLTPITWTAYGITFNAPKGILVEEDTEDTFLLNNAHFYITVHSLDSEGIEMGELGELLKGLADDDGVLEQSEVVEMDIPQFYCRYLMGKTEEKGSCCYACLMTKDAGSAFYISIIHELADSKIVEKILKSVKMEEE